MQRGKELEMRKALRTKQWPADTLRKLVTGCGNRLVGEGQWVTRLLRVSVRRECHLVWDPWPRFIELSLENSWKHAASRLLPPIVMVGEGLELLRLTSERKKEKGWQDDEVIVNNALVSYVRQSARPAYAYA